MNIYEALKKDHRELKELLNQLISTSADDEHTRHELVEQIRDALIPHARAEEMVLYNTLRSLDATHKAVAGSYQEHLEAETLLRTLQMKDKADTDWKETAVQLQDSLEHHIIDEEHRVFSAAKGVLSESEVEMMGKAFEQLKPGIKKESIVGTTMDLVVNMMPPRFTSTFRKNNLSF